MRPTISRTPSTRRSTSGPGPTSGWGSGSVESGAGMAFGVDRPVAQPADRAAAGDEHGRLGDEAGGLVAVEVDAQAGRIAVERLARLGVDQQLLEDDDDALRLGVEA